jgi:S-(hydroxymethyl)glutathione dehydrogenase/alcohol dehydrogenase
MDIKTTEAAILFESGKPLKIETIDLPNRLYDNQILVELITSGICGAQINEIDAVKGPDRFLPHLLGHEGYGQVVEVGPKVSKVSKGDHVVLHWRPSSGDQSIAPLYGWGGRVLNAGWVTTFNRHAVVSENRITKIPRGYDENFLPLLGCALTTALGVLKNEAEVDTEDHVLIFGLGGVGNAVLQFSRMLGAKQITVVDIDEKKRALALESGADSFIVYKSKSDTLSKLEKILAQSEKPSVAIETTGQIDCIEICYESTAERSRIILVGVPAYGQKASFYTLPLHLGKSLSGSKGGSSKPEEDIPEILNMLDGGLLNSEYFPTQVYPFSGINEAIEDLREGVPFRPILNFSKGT